MKKFSRIFLFVIMFSLFLVGTSTLKITITSTSIDSKEENEDSCAGSYYGEYKIVFDTAGGNAIETLTIKTNSNGRYIPDPTRSGYEFEGWFYDLEFAFPAPEHTDDIVTYINTTMPNCTATYDDVTLHAKWKEKEKPVPLCPTEADEVFAVSFETYGGEAISPIYVTLYQFGGPKLPTPTRFGYQFEGWYYDTYFSRPAPISTDEIKTALVTDEKGCELGPQDLTFYAKWKKSEIHCTDPKPGTFRLVYNTNGGNAIGATVLSTNNRTNGPKLPVPVKEGYSFEGWYYEQSYSQIVTSTDVVIPPHMYDIYGCHTSWGDVTIYAKWKKNAVKCKEPKSGLFKVIFVPNGGNKIDSITLATDRVSEVNLPNPTKEGYEFLGWYLNSGFSKKVSDTTSGITPTKKYDNNNCLVGWYNVTLYAKWIKKEDIPCTPLENETFTLKYNTNGGNSIKDITVDARSTSKTQIPVPVRRGYKFSAWYYDSNYTKKAPANIEEIVTEKIVDSRGCETGYKTVELFAKWLTESGECLKIEKGTFILEYVVNSGDNIKSITLTSDGKNGVDLPIPVRKDYKFDGWYYDNEYKNEVPSNTKDIVTSRVIDADGCESGWEDLKIYAKWYSSNSTTLYGILIDSNGTPLSKHTIEIQDKETIKTTTSENGTYRLENVKSGIHTLYIKDEQDNPIASSSISIVQDGYTNVDMNVISYDDKGAPIDIMLNTANEIVFISKENDFNKIVINIAIGIAIIAILILLKIKKKKTYHFKRK